MKQLIIKIKKELHDELKKKAIEENKTLRKMITELLENYLKK